MTFPSKPRLSIGERLGLAAKLTTLVPFRLALYTTYLIYFSLRNRFRVRFYFMCAAVRMIFLTLSGRQIQYLTPTTRQSYQGWVTKKAKSKAVRASSADAARVVRDIEPLSADDDSAVLWIGNRHKAKKFVIFFHGGGYVATALPGHFEWCWNSYVRTGAEVGVEVAVAFLQYTMCPGGVFPTQLRQAAATLGSLLDSGIDPADISIGGDSAGGNLTAQLIGHLLHPNPGARRIELTEPLGGAFLVSPWLSVDTRSPSFVANDYNDMISSKVVQRLGTEYFGGVEGFKQACRGKNPWATPMDVDTSWFKGIDDVVARIYVTVGKREVLADHGIKFVKVLRTLGVMSDIRLEETEGEAHDWILLEGEVGSVGDATKRMKDWYKSVISVN
ncbi:alpha/beta hydrolase fold protein [Purpureocillium lilacinum]|uniref:Alpha/beta hydrolase fold protein n=1 Tax=Purpureocillium lilacinum TaxID=33203 RepID=A0A179HVB6_PURLI|nr:alpha/beta hydrolase fold protein [Purpureocillium lilacinum]OAQ94327.1 alpha/beta hydrolase fold protein [Purpureocillium lilacinum]